MELPDSDDAADRIAMLQDRFNTAGEDEDEIRQAAYDELLTEHFDGVEPAATEFVMFGHVSEDLVAEHDLDIPDEITVEKAPV